MTAIDTYRVLRWEAPPPPTHPARARTGGRQPRWNDVAAQLRDHSGTWAVIFSGGHGHTSRAQSLASHIRMGQMRCFTPTGDFEATVRQSGGVVTVYARHLDQEDGDG